MPDKKYVECDRVTVKNAFDNKYKSSLPARIQNAVGAAIRASSKLTTKPPTDKAAKGLSIMGSVSLTKTDKGIEAEIEWTLSYWPKIKMFGRAHSTASTEVANPEKIDGEVDAVIDGLVDDFRGRVLKTLEKTEPE